MSLTGPSRLSLFGVIFLGLIVLMLALVVFSLDRFHVETRALTKAVAELKRTGASDAGELRTELGKLRETIGDGQELLARSLRGARIDASSGNNGESDPLPPRPGLLKKLDKPAQTFPIGGMLVNATSEPPTLNRWITSAGRVPIICNYIHDGLFRLSLATLEPVPSLALRWETSEDKLRYTFWLREGVSFSDGSPFTADDVVYTVNLIQDDNVKSDHYKEEFADVTEVVAENPYKVVFHYRKRYWRGIYAIGNTLRIYSANWVRSKIKEMAKKEGISDYSTEPGGKNFGKLYNKIRVPSVGTGPYRFDPDKSWLQGKQLTLYRNPRSWWFHDDANKWNLGLIRYRFINDDVVLWEEVRKRSVDARVVDPEKWFDSFQKDPSITKYFNMHRYDHAGIGHNFVAWNCRRPLFKDKRVRQAMAHLIDRKTMLEVFDRGVGDYATCLFKKWYPEYSFDLKPRLLDIPKAKRLLAEAGWKDTDRDGILDKNGQRFEFEIIVPSGRAEYTRWTQLWQGDMAKAGVKMISRSLEWATFINRYVDHDWDAACLYESHTDPWIEPYESFLSKFTGPGQSNHTGWSTPEVDALLESARTEFDPLKRREIFHRFNHIRWEATPQLYMLHGEVLVLIDKRFKNVVIQKKGANPMNWYVPVADRLYDSEGERIRK